MKKSTQNPKQVAGEHAARLVKNNMVVGLGTGSTTAYAIKELGRQIANGLKIQGVPTSYQSAFLAVENGIRLQHLMSIQSLTLTLMVQTSSRIS